MAVHPEHPGLEVRFYIKGFRAKEYDDDKPALPNTVTKYVEAISGARFKIKHTFTNPFPSIYGIKKVYYLDGKLVDSSVSLPSNLFIKAHTCSGAYSRISRQSFNQKFCFSPLATGKSALNGLAGISLMQ